ncbi:MAG: aldose 1-epimerase family protein [Angustibacter sp.]
MTLDASVRAPQPLPPSGEQVTIRHGRHEVDTVAVAAGLRAYRFDGRGLVDGFTEDERPSGGRGQTLLPWPNRIAGGRYELDGPQQLAITEPEHDTAIHGLGRWVTWQPVDVRADAVTWRYVVPPQPGWPTSLDCHVTYRLDDDGLTVSTRARNVGSARCLYGTGSHPYLTVGAALVDDATLSLPAATCFDTDARGIPTGSRAVDGTPADLREPRPIGDRVLDTAYADLTRDADGRWRARLEGPDGGVVLWADAAYPYAQVFTGDTLPEPLRRRGVAVEPMTCPPDAFNAADRAGAGVVVLEPGDEHEGTWGISPL